MAFRDYKVDLHCHLDGSLPLKTVKSLIFSQRGLFDKVELEAFSDDEYLKKVLTVSDDCDSLDEYLKCFSLPLKLLQTPDAMLVAGRGVAEELIRQNVRYAEVRFAPQLHSKHAIYNEKYEYEKEIIKALLRGIESVTKHSRTKINVLLCMMRNLPDGDEGWLANTRTLFLAKEYLGYGVCGVDLAGAEARDATAKFENFFRLANDQKIPFTIHVGEAGDDKWRLDSIERAIYFGAKRIGHGVGLKESKALRHIIRENGIVVECCPKSNLDTKAVTDGIESHPIKMLLDEGIKVTINTDNMTVSDTTLDKEYELLRTGLGLSDEEIRKTQLNAIDGAFISEKEKEKIKRREGF